MKTFLVSIIIAFALFSFDARSQCGRISLIGEFNGWAADEFMDRDPVTPEEFSIILVLTPEDDVDGNGVVEMKFRENGDWSNNWGSTSFPSGTAILNGPNIPVPIGSYLVTFNCENLHYYFQSTCGPISIIGEFSGWDEDYWMTRNATNPDEWSVILALNAGSDGNGDGIVEMKFRANSDWGNNWGSPDFPSGIGEQNGANIPALLTNSGITTDYLVTFNCATGAYNFTETCGAISLSGEFNDFTGDLFMDRDEEELSQFSVLLTLYPIDDQNGDGIVEMKFRENADNTVNWGSSQFPSGTAVLNGANINVPLDNTGITTDYLVTFNYSSLAFSFQSTSGSISIIGAFIGWMGDIPMNRDPESPNLWNLTRSWYANSDLKFRENKEWSVNWGNTGFPSGIGVPNGPNIPLIAGTYDVTFNAGTGAYNFVNNPDACGEIGLVGDFNGWGDEGMGYPSDIYMLRDPVYPGQFSLDYFFQETTGLLFRMNADPTFNDVWGGSSLCQTGVMDASQIIQVAPGMYHITFDCNSGDYCMTMSGNSVEAPKTFFINVDGLLDELDWDISQHLTKVIEGTPGMDMNEVYFGVVYSDDYLYVGIDVTDAFLTADEMGEIFIDGNNSGGAYDESDLYLRFSGTAIQVIYPDTIPGIMIGFSIKPWGSGYTTEFSIPWAPLGITATEGEQIGFDVIIGDDDSYPDVDYKMAWNGSLENEYSTSGFGELIFGPPFYGTISMYNDVTGDVMLRNPTNQPETYVATYDFDDDFDVVFRKDKTDNFFWGATEFPSGTALLGGPAIPAVEGRYRITFDCRTGEYSFWDSPAGENVAMAYYAEEAPVIDGQVDEYDLLYGCNILSAGGGPINNVVNWGARWDMGSLYIGVQVIDEALFGSGNPWDNDAIEFYIDGNNDKDGPYDLDFDTQIIMDVLNQSVPWFKADGVPVTNYNAQWIYTGLGYNVEIRLGWANFDFEPGRGRVIGWSLGNNDNDLNAGRDYQAVWYGTGNNWSNTSDLGDLQLADGPYYTQISEKNILDNVLIFPNPSDGAFSIMLIGNRSVENFRVTIFDISGRLIANETCSIIGEDDLVSLNLGNATPGLYIIHIYSDNGDHFVKKLIIQ